MILEAGHKTLVSEFETGKEQRRQAWAFPRRTIKLSFDPLLAADVDTIYNFLLARKGSFEPFYYFWPWKNPGNVWQSYTGEYIGRGTGALTTFNLPARNVTQGSLVVYVDGVQTAVTFSSGTGANNVDQIVFAVAPANGATITANLTGQLRLRMRLKTDAVTKDYFAFLLGRLGLELIEVRE